MMQTLILISTAVAIFLTLRKREGLRFAGSVVGIGAQILWFVETLAHEQYGFFVLSLLFFALYVHGCWVYRPKRQQATPTNETPQYDSIPNVRNFIREASYYGLEGEVVVFAIQNANPEADPDRCVADAFDEWVK